MKFTVYVNKDNTIFTTKKEIKDYYYFLMKNDNDIYPNMAKEFVLEALGDYYSIEDIYQMIYNKDMEEIEKFKEYCLKLNEQYYKEEFDNFIEEIEEQEIDIPDNIIKERFKKDLIE